LVHEVGVGGGRGEPSGNAGMPVKMRLKDAKTPKIRPISS